MEFVTTKRGARCLLHDGYRYTINRRTLDDQTYWRCADRKCPGRAITSADDQLVSKNDKHNHPPNTTEIELEKIKESMKVRAHQETTPVPQIYHDTLAVVSQQRDDAVAIIATYTSIRSTLYRKRRQNLPPLPETVDDITFHGEWSKTTRGEDFMLGSRQGVYLFSTRDNLTILSEASTYFMDGTF